MRYPILFSIFALLLFSCNKDKYTTTPQLKYESVNTKVLKQGDIITFTLTFTDAEGDLLADSALYVKKVDAKCAASNFDQYYKLPADFPTSKNQSGELKVTYGYNVTAYPPIVTPQCPNRNDTCVFKFVLRDKAGNKSDTATSETIVIIR